MNEEEIIKICKLICGTKNKKGKREYNTIERMNLLRDYNEDTLEEAIQGLLDLYNKEKSLNKIIKSKTVKDICYNIGEFDNRFISKDKILDILGYEEDDEQRKNMTTEKILRLIETIFEECDRLEDIEDIKVQVEIQNIENRRDEYWKDKIREKIKDLKENNNGDDYNLTNVTMILKELLKE